MPGFNTGIGGFLQKHAYDNVWCTPNQDKHAIVKPKRVSRSSGVRNNITVMWRTHSLPNKTSRFHVFHFGLIYPILLGLKNSSNNWINAQEVCSQLSLMVDIYTAKGIQIPKHNVWYKVTREQDLIFAVMNPDADKFDTNLSEEDVYFRFYRNAFYESTRADEALEVVKVSGKDTQSVSDILQLQNDMALYRSYGKGHVYGFINGRYVNDVNLINCEPGDSVEVIYDSSIRQVFEIKITDLKNFISVRDGVQKYLVHNPTRIGTIDFYDDLDFFIIKNDSGKKHGRYYNRNSERSVRMVTHQDYSLPVSDVAMFGTYLDNWNNVEELSVLVHVKESGYIRPLVFEKNRIHELYRLDDDKLIKAMVGIDSTVNEWTAAGLENSEYVKLMESKIGEITKERVQKSYGYNALSKLLADSPIKTRKQSNMTVVDIPSGLQGGCTAYEYDVQGHLTGWKYHTGGVTYVTLNPLTDMVELVGGQFSESLDEMRNQLSGQIDPNWNYRFYYRNTQIGQGSTTWQDVTNTGSYLVSGSNYSWTLDPSAREFIVLSNKKHLLYEYDYTVDSGLISLTLRHYRQDIQDYRTIDFPLGNIDVFLNGRSLVKDLDYKIIFPRIIITNKEYLDDPDNKTQKVVIRMSGFCNSEMKFIADDDVGFVEHGALSKNNKYDIRDDKINRIIVGGALYHKSELEFGEEDFSIRPTDSRNGSPYVIRDVFVPVNPYLTPDTGQYVDPSFQLKEQAEETDSRISAYLSLKIPEKSTNQPNAIPDLYMVYSPFFGKIISDLVSGAINDPELKQHYGEDFIADRLSSYFELLQFDPVTDGNNPDKKYVIIHPHPYSNYIELDIYQLKFLKKVVDIYGNDLIDISSFVKMKSSS